jgi:hypothetical protein
MLYRSREIRVLGEKAVARVDRVGTALLGGCDQLRGVEIALAARGRSDADRLVGRARRRDRPRSRPPRNGVPAPGRRARSAPRSRPGWR